MVLLYSTGTNRTNLAMCIGTLYMYNIFCIVGTMHIRHCTDNIQATAIVRLAIDTVADNICAAAAAAAAVSVQCSFFFLVFG